VSEAPLKLMDGEHESADHLSAAALESDASSCTRGIRCALAGPQLAIKASVQREPSERIGGLACGLPRLVVLAYRYDQLSHTAPIRPNTLRCGAEELELLDCVKIVPRVKLNAPAALVLALATVWLVRPKPQLRLR
jgi:hypothetical protein